uniref:Putative replicase n=1 Tax=Laksystermes virus TaxID=2796606 RepID=A0A7T7GV22_9VIRU|nr:putative replicase [Laksystermes virus]
MVRHLETRASKCKQVAKQTFTTNFTRRSLYIVFTIMARNCTFEEIYAGAYEVLGLDVSRWEDTAQEFLVNFTILKDLVDSDSSTISSSESSYEKVPYRKRQQIRRRLKTRASKYFYRAIEKEYKAAVRAAKLENRVLFASYQAQCLSPFDTALPQMKEIDIWGDEDWDSINQWANLYQCELDQIMVTDSIELDATNEIFVHRAAMRSGRQHILDVIERAMGIMNSPRETFVWPDVRFAAYHPLEENVTKYKRVVRIHNGAKLVLPGPLHVVFVNQAGYEDTLEGCEFSQVSGMVKHVLARQMHNGYVRYLEWWNQSSKQPAHGFLASLLFDSIIDYCKVYNRPMSHWQLVEVLYNTIWHLPWLSVETSEHVRDYLIKTGSTGSALHSCSLDDSFFHPDNGVGPTVMIQQNKISSRFHLESDMVSFDTMKTLFEGKKLRGELRRKVKDAQYTAYGEFSKLLAFDADSLIESISTAPSRNIQDIVEMLATRTHDQIDSFESLWVYNDLPLGELLHSITWFSNQPALVCEKMIPQPFEWNRQNFQYIDYGFSDEEGDYFDKYLKVHYRRNQHHPEHWQSKMSTVATIECLCDLYSCAQFMTTNSARAVAIMQEWLCEGGSKYANLNSSGVVWFLSRLRRYTRNSGIGNRLNNIQSLAYQKPVDMTLKRKVKECLQYWCYTHNKERTKGMRNSPDWDQTKFWNMYSPLWQCVPFQQYTLKQRIHASHVDKMMWQFTGIKTQHDYDKFSFPMMLAQWYKFCKFEHSIPLNDETNFPSLNIVTPKCLVDPSNGKVTTCQNKCGKVMFAKEMDEVKSVLETLVAQERDPADFTPFLQVISNMSRSVEQFAGQRKEQQDFERTVLEKLGTTSYSSAEEKLNQFLRLKPSLEGDISEIVKLGLDTIDVHASGFCTKLKTAVEKVSAIDVESINALGKSFMSTTTSDGVSNGVLDEAGGIIKGLLQFLLPRFEKGLWKGFGPMLREIVENPRLITTFLWIYVLWVNCQNTAFRTLLVVWILNILGITEAVISQFQEWFSGDDTTKVDVEAKGLFESVNLMDWLHKLWEAIKANSGWAFGIVAAIILFLICGKVAKAKDVKSLGQSFVESMRNMYFISAGLRGLEWMFKFFSTGFETVVNYIKKMFGYEVPLSEQEQFKIWKKDVGLLLAKTVFYENAIGAAAIQFSPKHCKEAATLYTEWCRLYTQYTKFDSKTVVGQGTSMSTNLNAIKPNITSISAICNFASNSHSRRMTPFHIQLVGEAGVGKSTLVHEFAAMFSRCVFPDISPDKTVFAWSPTSFKDGYKHQPIIVLDEAALVRDAKSAAEFILMISNNTMFIEMSEIKDKKTTFDSPIIISTSNVEYPDYSELFSNEANHRRRTMLIQVSADSAVMRDGEVSVDLVKSRYPKVNLVEYPHLKFKFLPPVANARSNKWYVGRVMDYQELAYTVLLECMEHMKKEATACMELRASWERTCENLREIKQQDWTLLHGKLESEFAKQEVNDLMRIKQNQAIEKMLTFDPDSAASTIGRVLFGTVDFDKYAEALYQDDKIKTNVKTSDFVQSVAEGKVDEFYMKAVLTAEQDGPKILYSNFIRFRKHDKENMLKIIDLLNKSGRLEYSKMSQVKAELNSGSLSYSTLCDGLVSDLVTNVLFKCNKVVPHSCFVEKCYVRSVHPCRKAEKALLSGDTHICNGCEVVGGKAYQSGDVWEVKKTPYIEDVNKNGFVLGKLDSSCKELMELMNKPMIFEEFDNLLVEPKCRELTYAGVPAPDLVERTVTLLKNGTLETVTDKFYCLQIPYCKWACEDIPATPINGNGICINISISEKPVDMWFDVRFLAMVKWLNDSTYESYSYCRKWVSRGPRKEAFVVFSLPRAPDCQATKKVIHGMVTEPWFHDSFAKFSMLTREQQNIVCTKWSASQQDLASIQIMLNHSAKSWYVRLYDNVVSGFSCAWTFVKTLFAPNLYKLLSLGLVAGCIAAAHFMFNLFNPPQPRAAAAYSTVGSTGRGTVLTPVVSKGDSETEISRVVEEDLNCVQEMAAMRNFIRRVKIKGVFAQMVGFYGGCWLVPRHAFCNAQRFMDEPTEIEIQMNDGMYHPMILYPEHVVLFDKTDAVVIYLPGCSFTPANRVGQFVKASDLNTMEYMVPQVMLGYSDENGEYRTMRVDTECARIKKPYNLTVYRVGQTMPIGVSFEMKIGVAAGVSGGLVSMVSKSSNRKFVGMVAAGSATKTFVNVVFQEDLIRAINALALRDHRVIAVQQGPFDADENVCPKSATVVTSALNIIGQVSPQHRTSTPVKTKIVRTPVAKFFPPSLRQPPAMTAEDPRVKDGKHPIMHSINKHGRDVMLPLNPVLLEGSVQNIVAELNQLLGPIERFDRPVLEVSEVFIGLSNLTRVNPKTSAGLPWCLERDIKGKRKYLSFDDEGNAIVHKKVVDSMDYFDRSIREGIIPNVSSVEFIKDELRPIEKVLKPRTITCLPLEMMLLFRKYFGRFENAMHQLGDGNYEFCVGIDMESRHGHDLFQNLQYVGEFGFDMDVSNWDGHMTEQLFSAVLQVVEGVMRDSDLGNKMARWSIVMQALFSYVQWKDLCYQKWRGMPSGFGGTALFNTIAHQILFYYLYCKVCMKKNKYEWIPHAVYKRNLCVRFYGDDVLCSVSDELREWFLPQDILDEYAKYGWPCTPAKKNSFGLAEYQHITELQFLKRTPRYLENFGQWTWCLEKAVIYDLCVYFKPPKIDRVFQLRSNFQDALDFAWHHGREFFEELNKLIYESSRSVGIVPTWVSFFEMTIRKMIRMKLSNRGVYREEDVERSFIEGLPHDNLPFIQIWRRGSLVQPALAVIPEEGQCEKNESVVEGSQETAQA